MIFGISNEGMVVGLEDPEGDAEKISEVIKTRLDPIPEFMRIPLERNSLHASAGRLSAPNGKFFKLHWITHVLAI